MKTYTVVSNQLSRKRGQTFTDHEIGEGQVQLLVRGGHLKLQEDEDSATATDS